MRTDHSPSRPRECRPAGRPKFYNPSELLDTYLYVEEQKRRTGLSANKISRHGQFSWHRIGRGGPTPAKVISRETLRRRYQEACKPLKEEQDQYTRFRNSLTADCRANRYSDELCPTMRWLEDEVDRRMAAEA